jgi:homogentisate solanesyltransferase
MFLAVSGRCLQVERAGLNHVGLKLHRRAGFCGDQVRFACRTTPKRSGDVLRRLYASAPASESGNASAGTGVSAGLSVAREGHIDQVRDKNGSAQLWLSFERRFAALYAFTRPHTVRGTFLAALTGCIRAIIDSREQLLARSKSSAGSLVPAGRLGSEFLGTLTGILVSLDWTLVPKALWGIFALVLGNAFIVGINQIYDRDVDRVNKPFLPLAAGMMTTKQAWMLCIASIALGVWIVYRHFSRTILGLYLVGTTIGALYSVPPFRWRNVPLLAALTIACVRGLLLNIGVYVATKEALRLNLSWTPALRLFIMIMSVFAGVIAVTKDLPDVHGDRLHQVPTFASRLGVAKVARMASATLSSMLVGVAAISLMPEARFHFRVWVLGFGHLALSWYFLTQVHGRLMRLGPENLEALRTYYKGIWNVFYLEFLLYIFI